MVNGEMNERVVLKLETFNRKTNENTMLNLLKLSISCWCDQNTLEIILNSCNIETFA